MHPLFTYNTVSNSVKNNKLSFKSETTNNIPTIQFLNENNLSFKKVFSLYK